MFGCFMNLGLPCEKRFGYLEELADFGKSVDCFWKAGGGLRGRDARRCDVQIKTSSPCVPFRFSIGGVVVAV
jgi:hypothetical protein